MMKNLLIYLITIYQKTFSYLIGNQCRFYPSCSQYTKISIIRHGTIKGSWLALKRISKCHPLSEGGYDPVPGQISEPDPIHPRIKS